jgi:hypothetical protein
MLPLSRKTFLPATLTILLLVPAAAPAQPGRLVARLTRALRMAEAKLSRDQNADADGPAIPEGFLPGKVIGIDTKRDTLTLTVATGRGVQQLFELSRGAAILTSNGKAGKLAELAADADVFVKLDADRKEVVAVRAEPMPVRVTLDAVDAAHKTLTATDPRKGRKTYTVDADAPVTVNGKDVGLDELKAGAPAILLVSGDGKTVVRVLVGAGRK